MSEAMLIVALAALMALFLAYANGANDNFKGVATLYGSNTVSYKTAITLATVTTFAGSITSIFVAAALVKVFSGKGVVPDQIAASTAFLAAVGAGAAGTVMLATVLGFPISTTHGLTGAIIGSGVVAVGAEINLKVLGGSFFAPLLLGPVLAIGLTALLYRGLKRLEARFVITGDTCLCIGAAQMVPAVALPATSGASQSIALAPNADPALLVGSTTDCLVRNHGQLLVAPVHKLVDYAHYISAGALSFARGLNDTPKMVALLLVLQAFDAWLGAIAIALAMAIGGLLNARKVAHTMSKKICRMDGGQALTANMVSAVLVIGASPMGLPLSTTHVSVGAITGVGLINGTVDTKVLSSILLSWLVTLPVAALISGGVYVVLRCFA